MTKYIFLNCPLFSSCPTGPATLPSVNFRDFWDKVPSRQSELSVSFFFFATFTGSSVNCCLDVHMRISNQHAVSSWWIGYCATWNNYLKHDSVHLLHCGTKLPFSTVHTQSPKPMVMNVQRYFQIKKNKVWMDPNLLQVNFTINGHIGENAYNCIQLNFMRNLNHKPC